MLDMTAIIATHLRAHPPLVALLTDAIYADEAPSGATVPFAVVRPLADDPLFADVDTWSLASLSVDLIGDPDDMPEIRSIVTEARRALRAMRGQVIGGAVIQAVDPISAAFSYDPTFTPSLPRWVLTVSMTVRSITPEGVVV